MKIWNLTAAALAVGVAGCNQANSPQQVAGPGATPPSDAVEVQPVKLTAEQELERYCRVCVIDKGEKIQEYFPSRLDTKYDGKLYKLCSDDCKKRFDANPKKYALN